METLTVKYAAQSDAFQDYLLAQQDKLNLNTDWAFNLYMVNSRRTGTFRGYSIHVTHNDEEVTSTGPLYGDPYGIRTRLALRKAVRKAKRVIR